VKIDVSKIRNLVSNFYWDIGVDLGTSNTLVYLRDRGVVIDEPTMISRLKKKRWTGLSAPKWKGSTSVAFGLKAKEMLNREPQQIEVISPIKNGIISDLEAIENLVAYYLKLIYEIPSSYPKIFKPRVIVSVPGSVSDVQKRAVRSVFLNAGAREVVLIEGVVLAAVGLGLPTEKSAGLMIVDIGGGKTEVGVVSMGGVVVGKGIKTAGGDLDTALMNYVKMKYGLLIGQNSAEKAKVELGNMWEKEAVQKKTVLLRGRDLETGLPKTIKLNESEIREAIFFEAQKIIKLIKEELDETPPELMEDVLKRGIVLVGNGALLKGLDRLVEKETKISARVADEPGLCVIKGCGELMADPKLFENIRVVSGLGK
jgi:rod shape-determining protein MreB and related proteins